jgi:hypothetical protein
MIRSPSPKEARAALERAYRAPAVQPITRKRRRWWSLGWAVVLTLVLVVLAVFTARPLALDGPLPSMQDVPPPIFALTR